MGPRPPAREPLVVIADMLCRLKQSARRRLEHVLPPHSSNFEFNRRLWDRYARDWHPKRVALEGARGRTARDISILGDEWGDPADLEQVLEMFVFPHVAAESIVGELGVGGGRVARRVAGLVRELYCFDVSPQMLRRARETLSGHDNVEYVLLRKPEVPPDLQGRFHFVYAIDVFVHLDLHTMWKYFEGIHRLLKPGGKALVHTANLTAPGGWARFSAQSRYRVDGHYFVSPEIVATLASRSGLTVTETSAPDEKNFYLDRDFFAVLEKT